MSLTDEQEQFLAECEAQFSARFTEADKDFMKVKEAGQSQPPVIQPWYARQRGGGGGRGNRGRQEFRGHRGRDRHRDDHRGERHREDHRDRYGDDQRDRSRDDQRDREREESRRKRELERDGDRGHVGGWEDKGGWN